MELVFFKIINIKIKIKDDIVSNKMFIFIDDLMPSEEDIIFN